MTVLNSIRDPIQASIQDPTGSPVSAPMLRIMKDADADQSINITLSLPAGKNLVLDHGDGNSTNVSGPESIVTHTVAYGDALAYEIQITGDLDTVTYLKIIREPISKITNIHYLTGLTYLNLNSNVLTDIGSVAKLTSLTLLRLYSNALTDIGFVADLILLTHLEIYGNNLTGIGSITNLVNLLRLYLNSNSFSSTELSDYVDQAWTNRAALGALSCAIKIEDNDSTPSCDADAVAKIEGNAPYAGDGLKDAGCTVTYDA